VNSSTTSTVAERPVDFAVQVCVVTWITHSPPPLIRGALMVRVQCCPNAAPIAATLSAPWCRPPCGSEDGCSIRMSGANSASAPAPVARREPPRELGHDKNTSVGTGRWHQRCRWSGWMVGKKPLTVPSLIWVTARLRLKRAAWVFSSASMRAMPITARAAMSGDSNGKP